MTDTDRRGDRSPALRLLCHGDPDRCYKFRGRPMPLCARCMAFYPIMVIASVLALPPFMMCTVDALTVTIIFAVLLSPLVLDGVTQYLGWRRSNNLLRTVTGALGGAGCGMALAYLLARSIGSVS